jgi:hypothetical protein
MDAHLAAHAIPAAQAQEQGAAGVTVTGPMTDPRFTPATDDDRRAARARFDLPEDAPLALLVAGSWGVGPVREAAAEILDTGVALPVVVCGRNHALAERLRADGIPHVHEWVDDMPGLMHACDVLVQNAGGLTSLEALASGLPVVSYRCIPGHGQTNAAALDEAGLAPWIREPHDLAPTLTELLHGPRGQEQRAAGLALYTSAASGPAQTVAALARRPLSAVPPRTPRRLSAIPPQTRRRLSAGRQGMPGRQVDVPSEVLGDLAAVQSEEPGGPVDVPLEALGRALGVPSEALGHTAAVQLEAPSRRFAVLPAIPGLLAAVRAKPAASAPAAVRAVAPRRMVAVRSAAPRPPAAAPLGSRANPVAATRLGATPRQARRRMILMTAAVAATVSMGIGAPLADAISEAPGHHLGALTHYLEDDGR